MNFLPLHSYSGYSYLQSGISLNRLVSIYAKKGYKYAPICDFNSITAYPSLTELATKLNLKPLYGMDTVIEKYNVSFFVKNEEGYLNLLKIIYLLNKGELDAKEVSSYSNGLILIFDGGKGKLKEAITKHDNSLSLDLASKFSAFKEAYIGIPYLPEEKEYISLLRDFASRYGYISLAYPFILYEKKEDAIALEIVNAIASTRQLNIKGKEGTNYFLEEEILTSYYDDSELFSCKKIAESVDFSFYRKRGKLPSFKNDLGMDSSSYLAKLAREGLAKKVNPISKEYEDRLNYELNVISKMGYSDYFLIVADYCKKAREKGIIVGPGRGSSAGSLVSYSLDIVKADPIKFGLLFERFLNPQRQTLPDIDVDFEDIRREEIIDYLKEKYGEEKVAHILVIQTLGPKASLHDIGRVYNIENREIDLLAKTLADSKNSLRESYKKNKQFKDLIDSDPYYLNIVSLAAKIENLPRQSGVHPSGVILNGESLENVLPIKKDEQGDVICFEAGYLEKQGFLKMDLLGIRYLTTIHSCLDLIKNRRGITLKYEDLPYDDAKSIQTIRAGLTNGIFQLESKGMNNAIKTLRPTTFLDIVALIALYRPGPMGFIPTYAKRKQGLEKVTYLNKETEEILSSTYGIIVYQEQIMLLVMKMAGLSLGEADLFRRAIAKKDESQLKALRSQFIEGCLKKGYSNEAASKTFEQIYKFASYGFNKSHSVSYAFLVCQMAYLKTYYPEEFYSSYLSTLTPSDPKFKSAYLEAKKIGIKFVLPDINTATTYFLPLKEKEIMFPLSSINLTESIGLARNIIRERKASGPFLDLFSFAARLKRYGLKKESLLRLIDAGCFDSFPYNRASKRLSVMEALSYAEMMQNEDGSALLDFNFPLPQIKQIQGSTEMDLLYEKEALGVMVSGSLLSGKENIIKENNAKSLQAIEEDDSYSFIGAGIVSSIKAISTKKGNRMAFLSLYDDTNQMEFTLFPSTYDSYYPLLKEGTILIIKGHRDNYKKSSYIVDEIKKI